LTRKGRKQLADQTKRWHSYSQAVSLLLTKSSI
jgi:hypothetical protein